jgi:hypothetical protein
VRQTTLEPKPTAKYRQTVWRGKGSDRAKEEPDSPAEREVKDKTPVRKFIDWAKDIPTARGIRLDFARYPFQVEIYEVLGDPEIEEADVMKSTQIGMSELLTRLALFFADMLGATSLYVFPALKQMYEFASTRVDPLREQSPYLQSRSQLGPRWPWNKGLKKIGTHAKSGFVYYRGSESRNDLIAVDADVVVMDEYDSLSPKGVPEAERRVGASSLGLIRRVGVPSHPEFGIAKRYETSDKRAWHVECGGCGEFQTLDFHKNVRWDEPDPGVIENPRVVCRHCEHPIDVLKGEWVAAHPERRRVGFHVNRLMVPGERNLRNVIEASKRRLPIEVKSFWNNDLGLPYSDETGGLDRATLAAAISQGSTWYGQAVGKPGMPMLQADTPGYTGTNVVTMGVDVASARALNVRISEHLDPLHIDGHRKRALYVGTADSFDEIIDLLNRYQVSVCVIDHLPEMRLALGVAERFPGRVYLCRYNTAGKQTEPLVVDTEARTVSVLRVPAMDATVAVMRGLRNLLPEDVPDEYVEHMLAPRRIIEKDQYDRTTVRWESKGPDDYFQCECYDVIATEVARIRMAVEEIVEPEQRMLDDMLEFRRSAVDDYSSEEYHPGPGVSDYGDDDDFYHHGPGELD